jgi:hypothetical protein
MIIRKILLVAAAALFCVSQEAAAQDMPDMKGVWKGTTQAVHVGDLPHRKNAKPGHNFGKVINISITIAEQEANMFKGHVEVGDQEEVLIGSFHPATQSGVAVDSDGAMSFTLDGTDAMHVCYWIMSTTAKATACFTLNREK